MAQTTWVESAKNDHPHPKCWYEPAAFPYEAELGLRWTLSQPITAAIPPGDERYFRLGMDIGQNFQPIYGIRDAHADRWNRGSEPAV
jgi:hypothetical protein